MDGTTDHRGEGEENAGYSIGYGPSKDQMFYVMMFYVGVMVMAVFFIAWKFRGYNRPEASFIQALQLGEREEDDVENPGREANPTTGARRRRNIRARIQENVGTVAGEQGSDEELDEGDEDADQKDHKPPEKIGAKKLRKIQEKEERKRERVRMEMERADRKKKQEETEEKRKREEEKQAELEKQKEEEEKKAKEQREKEEHELYLELKKSFEVNEEGQQEISNEEQNQNQLKEFIAYIKRKKVVLLEDLASHFGLRTQDAIDRVQNMLKDEIITGVIDDRGKFIYVSRDELVAVANFVKQRGRIDISELAAASNSLINLQFETVAEPSVL